MSRTKKKTTIFYSCGLNIHIAHVSLQIENREKLYHGKIDKQESGKNTQITTTTICDHFRIEQVKPTPTNHFYLISMKTVHVICNLFSHSLSPSPPFPGYNTSLSLTLSTQQPKNMQKNLISNGNVVLKLVLFIRFIIVVVAFNFLFFILSNIFPHKSFPNVCLCVCVHKCFIYTFGINKNGLNLADSRTKHE